jgi:hypothetical protein
MPPWPSDFGDWFASLPSSAGDLPTARRPWLHPRIPVAHAVLGRELDRQHGAVVARLLLSDGSDRVAG